jgi:isochorismate synthase EntC
MHYDENAPVKSKKLEKKDREESRFDIYTPERIFMLKGEGLIDATQWIDVLQKAAKRYNKQGYGKVVLPRRKSVYSKE